jgi:hypothetical protein
LKDRHLEISHLQTALAARAKQHWKLGEGQWYNRPSSRVQGAAKLIFYKKNDPFHVLQVLLKLYSQMKGNAVRICNFVHF